MQAAISTCAFSAVRRRSTWLTRTAVLPRARKLAVSRLSRPLSLLAAAAAPSPVPDPDPEESMPASGLPPKPPRLTDQEWDMRTGRAIYVLTQTLPDFFRTGLVDGIDLVRPLDAGRDRRPGLEDETDESIYATNVRLEYTPPLVLPAPFPRTFWAQGLPLYLASAAFVRHSLRALYTSLSVTLARVRVEGASKSGGAPGRPAASLGRRERRLSIVMKVTGVSRVSGAAAEWDVRCTYTFSPDTGAIALHIVDAIEPAPHESMYYALLGLFGGNNGVGHIPDGHGATASPEPVRIARPRKPGEGRD